MRFVFAFCLLILIGCGSNLHHVVNKNDYMLYAVTVASGETSFGHGYLTPGAEAGYHGPMSISRTPPPIISWRTSEDGEIIRREVHLAEDPGGRKVVFEIDGTNVVARLE